MIYRFMQVIAAWWWRKNTPPKECWLRIYGHDGNQIGPARAIVAYPTTPGHWENNDSNFPDIDRTMVARVTMIDSEGNTAEVTVRTP